jgi:HEAT repeat protein
MTRPSRNILFGVLCGSFLMASVAWAGQPSTDELIQKLSSPEESVRLQAISELGTPGRDAAAISALVGLLRDDSAVIRAHAAKALGAIGAPATSAARNLVALLADPDQAVRRQAVGALIAIRPGPKVTVPLFVRLMADSDEAVRMRVLQALADAGPEAVPPMVRALKNDAVAYWACLVLRDIGPKAAAAVPALTEKLQDPDVQIRREATLALAAIGPAAAPAVDKIAMLLGDEPTRIPATYALGSIGQIPKDAETTIRANAKSDHSLLSTVSLWALARVHPEDKQLQREAIETLVGRLNDKDPYVRVAAARGLASLPPQPEIAIPAMEKVLAGADQATVHHALDALAGLGAPAVPRLIEALKHERLRPQVVYILGQIGPAAAPATEALVGLIRDKNADVANEAVHALAKIGPAAKAAVGALLEEVRNPESPVRHAAIYALGKMGPSAAAAQPDLLQLVKGPECPLSLIGAWALVEIGGPTEEVASAVVPALTAGLKDSLPKAQEAAAEALGALGPLAKDAVGPLTEASTDKNESVRAAAAKALRKIKGQP